MNVTDKKLNESRYPLRLPSDLREEVETLASENFHSVNAEIVRLIREGIKAIKQPQTQQPQHASH